MAYGFLAAAEVVLFMTLAPDGAADEMLDVLSPDFTAMPEIRECWPQSRPQYFPLAPVGHAMIHTLIEHPRHVFEAIGLPMGESVHETKQVFESFLAGIEVAELRSSWSVPARPRGD